MKKQVVLFALLVAFVCPLHAEKFLSVSDIHFDPFADPTLVPKLEKEDASQWEGIFATSSQTGFSARFVDINNALLRSAVAEMKKQIPSPAFVIISGDFIAHDFQKTYQKLATDKSQAAYTTFVTKTIDYVTSQFRRNWPGVTVYPVLGNNDSDCGDYAVAPNSRFLANLREVWAPLVGSRLFDKRFPTGGYYRADVPSLDRVRLIALNTNFFSTNYKNTCGKPGPDPGLQQLAWLEDELRLARAERRRVWLLFHIPPGIDVFDSVKYGGTCPNNKSGTFWKAEYQQKYLAITKRYRDTIIGSFAGHTHQDEFRFATDDFIHITPSVTPVFGNNPAFEIVEVTRRGAITNYTAHHLPNLTLPWKREYSFAEAYSKPAYDTTTLRQLSRAIGEDGPTRTQYFTFSSSGDPAVTQNALTNWRAYWCGFSAMTDAVFSTCYCKWASE